jgi:transposase-like protein
VGAVVFLGEVVGPVFVEVAVAADRSGMAPRLRDVAESLGVSAQTLRNWSKQIDVNAGRREGLSSDDQEELSKLRRRVRVLEQEREILKDAAAFFAKENDTR